MKKLLKEIEAINSKPNYKKLHKKYMAEIGGLIDKFVEQRCSEQQAMKVEESKYMKDFTKAIIAAINTGKTEFEFEGEMHPLHKLNLAPPKEKTKLQKQFKGRLGVLNH